MPMSATDLAAHRRLQSDAMRGQPRPTTLVDSILYDLTALYRRFRIRGE